LDELGDAVIEALPRGVPTADGVWRIAEEVVTRLEPLEVCPAHIHARAEPPPDAGEDDHLHLGVVVAGAHALADLRQRAGALGAADRGVEAVRAVELDPEDAVVLLLVEEVRDEFEFLHRALPSAG